MHRNTLTLLLPLILCLGFSLVLRASAIPATRTQNLKVEDTSSLPSLAKVEYVLKVGNGEEVLIDMDEGFMERRMDFETQDYGGTGANRDHDPNSPGGV